MPASRSNAIQDDLHRCMHDIRNAKKLTSVQIEFIERLSSEDKMKIILAYDEVAQSLVETIELL